ncbi:MAG: hypothetical protein CMJ83_00525 [Planctomycetes bacterium]|nr:hypothetical protein [Planctomycetota bacterium]
MTTLSCRALCVALVVAAAPAQNPPSWPQSMTPQQAGISYDIVCCRMPTAGNESRDAFPDARNYSLYLGRGTDLILLHPNGTEETIYDSGTNGAVADPFVSHDGRTVYFTWFVDPENINTQRGLSWNPSHIMKIDLATRVVTQLTDGDEVAWQDSSHQIDPRYAKFDVAPVEMADGRILFLSSRDGTMDVHSRFPAMKFFRMEPDGSNVEPIENFTMGSCQHPFVLMDGRVVWTHFHPAGRRTTGVGNYPLFAMNPDASDIKTFAGAHYPATAWHFATQLSDGDVVTSVYYHQNNFGHGTLVRFPAQPGHASGNDFGPVSGSTSTWNNYGVNDHFERVGQTLSTPWTLYGALSYGTLSSDRASPLMPDGSRAGKCTMPAGAPGNDLLLVWSDGNVNILYRPTPELPHMKVCLIPGGTAAQRQDMIILKQDPAYQYMYPRAVVPYESIYGIPRPALIADTLNDGVHPALPAGAPFATTGTSSVYNRESLWPPAYDDPFDVNIVNNFALGTAFFSVGQDTYGFSNSEIWAAQVVADMSHIDRRYQSLQSRFASHNNDNQIWGILGEVPLRKTNGQGQPIMDPNGDPDTSYEVRIPADVPFHNRIIDRNGLTLTSEWTWHSARPGERKTNCGGCHAHSTDVSPLDFGATAAASPSYQITDFALQTPLVDHDAQGNLTVTTHPEKIRIVEYHRDVKPILDAKCVSCHGDANPAGGLDLEGPDAWDVLAYVHGPLFGHHQSTRWVRTHAATQSLLVWKIYGARLDGRTNSERINDVDYAGSIMPPLPSGIPPLTFQERRTLAQWIDLGCLVDTSPGTPLIGDPFDDQMKPTLTLSGPRPGFSSLPLPPLSIGAYDLHDGIDPSSLEVVVTPNGGSSSGNLAGGVTIADGQTVSIPLPALAPGLPHTVAVVVRDLAGNVTRRQLTLTPLSPASTTTLGAGSPGTNGLVPTLTSPVAPRIGAPDFVLRVADARPTTMSGLFVTTQLAQPPAAVGPGATLYLDPAELVTLAAAGVSPIALEPTSASGDRDFPFPIPPDPSLAGFTLHFQAVVLDPNGGQVGGVAGAMTAGLTIVLGG